MKGKRQCRWHWLLSQPIDVQIRHARARLALHTGEHRTRVPEAEWPLGERWCSGCQHFIPLFYVSGSRCKACASAAAHGSRVEKLYGITEEDYQALLEFQQGVCYICFRRPRTIRLAVDHDHRTGEVRGLLCANNENGCNRAVIANLEAARDDGISAAKRAVIYLTDPPYAQMRRGSTTSWGQLVRQEVVRLDARREERARQPSGQLPPF